MFLNGSEGWKFGNDLEALVEILAPVANSITCLESTSSTVSDVFVFWLACMVTTRDTILKDSHRLGAAVTEEVRHRMNTRWLQMIEKSPCDVYFTGFFLDPRAFRISACNMCTD